MVPTKVALAENLACDDLFGDLEKLDAEMIELLRRQREIEREIREREAEMAEIEAIVALGIEGKNETERKARRASALRDHPEHRRAMEALRAAEAELAEVSVRFEATKRKARRIERIIEYRIAMLRFMA